VGTGRRSSRVPFYDRRYLPKNRFFLALPAHEVHAWAAHADTDRRLATESLAQSVSGLDRRLLRQGWEAGTVNPP